MIQYIISFLLSCAFLFQAQKQNKKWNIWAIIGLLIPTLLASLRNENVGTDTGMYLYIYENIKEWTLTDFISTKVANVEIFYFFVSLIGEQITGFSTLLFIFQALNVFFLYETSYRLKNYLSIALVFFLYYIFLYSYSLNIMRQITAVMYILWLSHYLIRGKQTIFIAGTFIGMLIHSTAILGGIIAWICYKVYSAPERNRKEYLLISIVSIVFLSLVFSKIGGLLALFDIGEMARYGSYLENETSYIGKTDLIIRFMFLGLVFYLLSHRLINKNIGYSFIVLLCFEVALIFCGKYSTVIFRLSLYATAFDILIVPYLLNLKGITYNSRVICKMGLILICCVYWWYTVIFNGTNEIYPYLV